MALTQTRINDLTLYVQLSPGDTGYIPPNELNFVVDHSSFSRAKRYSQDNFTGAISNNAYDKYTGLSSRNVVVVFGTAFTSSPVGWVEVYRMEAMGSGFRRQDVLWTFVDANQPTLT